MEVTSKGCTMLLKEWKSRKKCIQNEVKSGHVQGAKYTGPRQIDTSFIAGWKESKIPYNHAWKIVKGRNVP